MVHFRIRSADFQSAFTGIAATKPTASRRSALSAFRAEPEISGLGKSDNLSLAGVQTAVSRRMTRIFTSLVAQEFRAERQLCPTTLVKISVLRPPFPGCHECTVMNCHECTCRSVGFCHSNSRYAVDHAWWPMWRNWQTRQTQNLVPERVCGFDPLRRHHPKISFIFALGLRRTILAQWREEGLPWLE